MARTIKTTTDRWYDAFRGAFLNVMFFLSQWIYDTKQVRDRKRFYSLYLTDDTEAEVIDKVAQELTLYYSVPIETVRKALDEYLNRVFFQGYLPYIDDLWVAFTDRFNEKEWGDKAPQEQRDVLNNFFKIG